MWKSRNLPRRQFRRNILHARQRISVCALPAKQFRQCPLRHGRKIIFVILSEAKDLCNLSPPENCIGPSLRSE
jgi:hypothetical protein